jgi:3-deoxy-manno-octulosonate cytidylyltransferase (CMP-KDO synthetase)
MTSSDHRSGTERVAEVAENLETPIIINIQGDEPLLQGRMIDDLVNVLQEDSIPMATLAAQVHDLDLIQDKDIVKVVVDKNGYALYFSRSPLPSHPLHSFFQHIGISKTIFAGIQPYSRFTVGTLRKTGAAEGPGKWFQDKGYPNRFAHLEC